MSCTILRLCNCSDQSVMGSNSTYVVKTLLSIGGCDMIFLYFWWYSHFLNTFKWIKSTINLRICCTFIKNPNWNLSKVFRPFAVALRCILLALIILEMCLRLRLEKARMYKKVQPFTSHVRTKNKDMKSKKLSADHKIVELVRIQEDSRAETASTKYWTKRFQIYILNTFAKQKFKLKTCLHFVIIGY